MAANKMTTAQLQQELIKIKAMDIGTLSEAKRKIDKAGANLFASACIVHITDYSGNSICEPFAILDGLSSTALTAIKTDIERTVDSRLAANGIKR